MNLGLPVTLYIAALIALAGALCSSCAAPESRSAEEVRFGEGLGTGAGKVTQAELQEDLQRFASVFMDRVAQALDSIRKARSPMVREEGTRRALLYGTSVLDIATEPSPEVGLLDMLVFIQLSRGALEDHWIPTVFKEEGSGLSLAFSRSESEIWAIADKVMAPEYQVGLRALVARWKEENPGQVRVEGVRLGDFARKAGKIAEERAHAAGGLLSSVSSGVEAADDALLMADRVLFLAQRMPFLLRMQASLGAGELVDSVTSKFGTEASLNEVLGNSRSLTQMAGQAAREGRLLAESLYPLILPKTYQLGNYLASANELAARSITILESLNSASPAAIRRLDSLFARLFLYLFLLFTGTAVIWWTGYYVVKRRLRSQEELLHDLQPNLGRNYRQEDGKQGKKAG